MFLLTGKRRFEQVVHEATLLQQTNGHAKMLEQGKPAEIREITTVQRQLSPMFPVKVFPAKASMQRRVANSTQSDSVNSAQFKAVARELTLQRTSFIVRFFAAVAQLH